MATDRLPEPALEQDADGRRVASYTDVRGASLAMRRLDELGLGDDAFVRPASLSAIDHALVMTPDAPDRRRAAAIGAVVAVLLLALTGLGLLPLVGGVTVGLAVLAVDDLRLRRLRARARRSSKVLRAERFDIMSTGAPSRIEHALATWWDPEAPVARRAQGGPTVAVTCAA